MKLADLMSVGLLLALVGCTPEEVASVTADPLSPAELEAATRRLTDIGARVNGMPTEVAALDVVEDMAREAGLEYELHAFTWDAWLPGSAAITVDGQTVEAHPLSPTRSAVGKTGELVGANAADVRGKYVLTSSDDGSRAEQFLLATVNGAAGMIRITDDLDHDGSALYEVGHTLDGTSLDSLVVDHFAGDILREHRGETITLDIESDVVENHESFNVLARIPGATSQAPVYVVAHYDSWHPSESAFDNALGVAAMFQLARDLEGTTPTRDIVFFATSGEEQGLQGALAWADDYPDLAADAHMVLVLDVIWAAEGRFWCSATTDWWREQALAAYDGSNIDVRDGGGVGVGSDHVPFITRGADAVWCQRWPDRHYHTTEDKADYLDFDEIAEVIEGQRQILAVAAGIE